VHRIRGKSGTKVEHIVEILGRISDSPQKPARRRDFQQIA
jgi:hypothetical protein